MRRLPGRLGPPGGALGRALASALWIASGIAIGLIAARFGAEVAAALVVVPAGLIAVLRRPLLGVAVWLVVAPLVETGPPAAFWIGHRLVPAVALTGAVGWCLLERRRPDRGSSTVLAIVMAFVALALVNVAFLAPQPRMAIVQLADNLLVPMALMAVVTLAPPAGRRDWILVGAAAGAALGGQLLALAAGWLTPQWLPATWALKVAERGAGTLVDPAPFSAFVVVTAVAVGVAALRSGLLRPQVAATLAGGTAIAVALSLSRGSWLAGGVVVVLAVLTAPRRLLRPVAAITLLAVFLGLGPLGAFADRLGARLVEDRQVANRVAVLEEQLAAIAASPLIGHGYGAFQERRRADEEGGVRRVASHNTYLGMAADFGVPLAALYLSPLGLLAWRDRRLITRRSTPSARPDGTAGLDDGPRLDLATDGHAVALMTLWLALIFQAIVSSFIDMGLGHAVGTGAWWLTIGLLVVLE